QPGYPQQPYGQPAAVQPPGAPAPLAEWWQRLLARLVDGVILGVANGLISAVLHSLLVTQATYDLTTGTYTAPSGLLLYAVVNGIVMAALLFGYEFIMLRTQGRTVGKIVLGLQVAQVGGATGNLDNGAILKRAAVLWGPFVLYAIPVVGA